MLIAVSILTLGILLLMTIRKFGWRVSWGIKHERGVNILYGLGVLAGVAAWLFWMMTGPVRPWQAMTFISVYMLVSAAYLAWTLRNVKT